MRVYVYILGFVTFAVLLQNCETKSEKTEENKVENVKETPAVVVDSSAFKVKKSEIEDFKIVEEQTPSSQAEVEKLVSSESTLGLDKYQEFSQKFISACASKNYAEAAKYIAYTGADKNRVGTDHFIYANANEKSVVDITADVVYNFLAESKDYKFISSKQAKNKKGEDVQVLEITFFKKGIGVNRRYFEVKDTPKGMLISNMK